MSGEEARLDRRSRLLDTYRRVQRQTKRANAKGQGFRVLLKAKPKVKTGSSAAESTSAVPTAVVKDDGDTEVEAYVSFMKPAAQFS
jgi:hypothetical protein